MISQSLEFYDSLFRKTEGLKTNSPKYKFLERKTDYSKGYADSLNKSYHDYLNGPYSLFFKRISVIDKNYFYTLDIDYNEEKVMFVNIHDKKKIKLDINQLNVKMDDLYLGKICQLIEDEGQYFKINTIIPPNALKIDKRLKASRSLSPCLNDIKIICLVDDHITSDKVERLSNLVEQKIVNAVVVLSSMSDLNFKENELANVNTKGVFLVFREILRFKYNDVLLPIIFSGSKINYDKFNDVDSFMQETINQGTYLPGFYLSGSANGVAIEKLETFDVDHFNDFVFIYKETAEEIYFKSLLTRFYGIASSYLISINVNDKIGHSATKGVVVEKI